ncbi:tyrosine-type recombinase/integrase [Alicyclobacillus fodiniaquatilis]|uniref:Tyrosine-type recombinase/integrase n=1 Tax=Alicyclobacillus fodiniaquatilis TaxID=1661150 RepID=A0ABW4JK87_9BACL
MDDRQLKNASPHTILGYQRTLGEFHQFCVNNEVVDSGDVTHSLIKRYFLHCQSERGNNAVTLNHKLINIRAFFNYAEAELELYNEKSNPIRKMSRFKTDVKIDVFTDHHIRQMLLYYRRLKQRDKTFYAYRDPTIIVLLLGTGIKVGELANLRWKDIDFDHDTITVFGKKRSMHRCLMAGMDVFTHQRLLRHSDLSMTQRYLAIWGTALKEQNDKYNPLNGISL